MRRRMAGVVLAAVGVLAITPLAKAATVTTTHDHGPGSLRAALAAATDDETIHVPAGDYKLTSGPLTTTATVTIAGAGATRTVLDAQGRSRVMVFGSGPGIIRLSGLTIRGGNGDGGDGGGIDSLSNLTLSRVAVLHNIAGTFSSLGNGGGVEAPILIIHRSLFAHNHGYNGGAVAGNQIEAVDSTFAFNSAGSSHPGENGDGGAFDDPVTLTDSTVAFNRCFNFPSCGGGIDNTATVTGTLIAGNRAYADNGEPVGSTGNPGAPNNCDSVITSEGHNLDSGQELCAHRPRRPLTEEPTSRQAEGQRRPDPDARDPQEQSGVQRRSAPLHGPGSARRSASAGTALRHRRIRATPLALARFRFTAPVTGASPRASRKTRQPNRRLRHRGGREPRLGPPACC